MLVRIELELVVTRESAPSLPTLHEPSPGPAIYLSLQTGHHGPMEELLRSNDLIYLSFVRHVLSEAGIVHVVLDEHMSAVEGSIGAIPRRIMVEASSLARAKLALGNSSFTIPR